MKSFLPISLIFILLVLLLSLVATPFYKGVVEDLLVGQTKEALSKAGIATAQPPVFKHHFLQLPDDIDYETQAKMAKLINSKVRGAYVPAPTAPKTPASVGVFRNDGDSILLTGSMPNESLKQEWEDLVKSNSNPGTTIDNQIVVSDNFGGEDWNKDVYAFSGGFIGTNGFKSIELDSKGMTLKGQVPSPDALVQIGGLARTSVGEGKNLDNQLSVRPPADQILPFKLKKSESGQFILSGVAPDEKSKLQFGNSVSEAVKAQGIKIENQLTVDPSVYPNGTWPESLQKYAGSFATVAGVTQIYAGAKQVVIEGEVAAGAIKAEQGELAKQAAGEGNSIDNRLTVTEVPSANFRLVQSKAGEYTVSGAVGEQKLRDNIGKSIGSVLGNKLAINEAVAVEADLKSPWWQGQSTQLIPYFLKATKVTDREINYTNHTLYLRGRLNSSEKIDKVSQLFAAGMPKGVKLDTTKLVETEATVEEVEAEVVSTFKNTAVYFDTSSSALKSTADAKIKEIASVIKSNKIERKLIVGGYADTRGNAEANKRLSLKRANSVKERLIGLGIPEQQMTLQHFGEEASNYKPQDLWRSRRVELSLGTDTEQ